MYDKAMKKAPNCSTNAEVAGLQRTSAPGKLTKVLPVKIQGLRVSKLNGNFPK